MTQLSALSFVAQRLVWGCWFGLVLTLGSVVINAQCTVQPSATAVSQDSTNSYTPHYNPALDSYPLYESTIPSYFRFNRVVGPGLTAEFDNSNPSLTGPILPVNWATYVQNGVAGAQAFVEVNAAVTASNVFWDFTHPLGNNFPVTVNGSIEFVLNGQSITSQVPFSFTVTTLADTPLTVPLNFGSNNCVPVDASLLRYARRLKDATGVAIPCPSSVTLLNKETTCPGINEIWAHIRTDHGTAGIGYSVSATRIIFQAMAPIVLVHGWNSGAWQWGPETPDPNGLCGAGQNGSDKGRATINTLITAKVPFDCSIRIDRQASIPAGAQVLLSAGVNPPSPSVAAIAAQFGSRFVHILAHSKGGLCSDRLRRLNPKTLLPMPI